jgi:hypothetical protein
VVINTLFPPGPLPASADSGAQALSPATRFLVEHLRALLTVLFVASGATLVAAIGLLRRRNWARVTLIAILGLGVAANLAALVIPSFVSLSVPGAVPTQSAAFDANVHWMISVLRAFLSFFAIAVSGLFAWLIRRLHSRSIRAEFS